ncbi:MAG TPA: class I SAM-dependent methyltransferase [Patescibacteria group bacterium]
MTKPLRAAIEIISDCLNSPKKILEVGSRQAVNQNDLADLRNLFPESKYIGLDMQPGPGVDLVASAENLPFPDKSFDVVFCLETLEHANKPWLICAEIERVLKPTGFAVISSQQNFPIHMHPSDYFRYTPMGLKALFPKLEHQLAFSISPPFDDEVKLNPQQVILVATKKDDQKILPKVKRSLRKNIGKISVHKPYRHRLQDGIKLLKRAISEAVFRQEIEFF